VRFCLHRGLKNRPVVAVCSSVNVVTRRGTRIARVAALLTAAPAILSLVGWTFDIPFLQAALCPGAAMNPITAACLVAAAIAVVVSLERSRSAALVRQSLALAIIGAAALRLATDVGMMRAPLDEVVFGAGLRGNRMAPNTAACLVAIGLALALLDRPARRGSLSTYVLALPAISGWLAISGYLFEALRLYGLPQRMPMALPTACALVVASVAIAFARPTREPFATLLDDSAGGRIARRLVPVALLAPGLLGFVRLEAQRAGVLSPEAGVSLMTIALSAALLVAITWVCLLVRRLDELLNRRGFIERAREQLVLAQRDERSSLVCFIDLDGLKGINDTLGHVAGDRAIASFARVLRSTFRESDVLARLGGDEFVVMAVGSADAEAVRARLATEVAAFNAEGSAPFKLAASVGIARSSPSSPASIEALLQEADEKMYAEKQARRAPKLRSVHPLVPASKRAA
jgi:diguanylate cyclase (GGDEF)-like protein